MYGYTSSARLGRRSVLDPPLLARPHDYKIHFATNVLSHTVISGGSPICGGSITAAHYLLQ